MHNILPSSDAKATINAKNLPDDLRQVPPGRRARASRSARSTSPKAAPSPRPCAGCREFYLLLIPVTIGLMLLHNGGDWLRKLIRAAVLASRRAAAAPAHAAARTRDPHAAVRARPARGAGDLLPDAGLDRLRAEVPRPVVGAPAAAAGRRALDAQPGPPRRGGGLHGVSA